MLARANDDPKHGGQQQPTDTIPLGGETATELRGWRGKLLREKGEGERGGAACAAYVVARSLLTNRERTTQKVTGNK